MIDKGSKTRDTDGSTTAALIQCGQQKRVCDMIIALM